MATWFDAAALQEDLRRLGLVMLAAGPIGYFLGKTVGLVAIFIGVFGFGLWLVGLVRWEKTAPPAQHSYAEVRDEQ